MSHTAASRQQIHLSCFHKTHFCSQVRSLRLERRSSDCDEQDEEFYKFLVKAGSKPEPRFRINGEDIKFYTFAEVWMWYRYYNATVRTWESPRASFRNKAYWSRIPSHYRSLKQLDKKRKALDKIIRGVEKKFPGLIEKYKDRLDGGECGFVWRVNSKPMTAEDDDDDATENENESSL